MEYWFYLLDKLYIIILVFALSADKNLYFYRNLGIALIVLKGINRSQALNSILEVVEPCRCRHKWAAAWFQWYLFNVMLSVIF